MQRDQHVWMERPGVRITRLCPIIVQFFLWKESVHTNSILECLQLSTFGPLWLRLLGNVFFYTIWLVCVWNWAQHMALERSSVHLSGMLSPTGQSLEQFLHETHFQLSGSRPISGVARRVGSFIQPVRRAVPQLIPEGLGTRFHLAVARDVEHPFLRPPTTYNPVVYASKYALQSERDCIAQRLEVAETLQVLADAENSENLHALRLVDHFLLPVVARRNFLAMPRGFCCDFLDGPKTDCRFVLWTAPAWVGHAGSNNAVARSASPVSN